ncbi:hypothetical protein GH714_029521 [Hevea brasiliensis]|uniref:Uncharacterized protein n=1 Tax=Hevea brasiliensis TaxID=3981 RepID=A0A6A6M2M1_HEVBR|nr:hypothetical protein GH714_029521 [Hevea brasiliensis]
MMRSFDTANNYDASLLAMNVSASIGQLSQFQQPRAAAEMTVAPLIPLDFLIIAWPVLLMESIKREMAILSSLAAVA